MHGTVLQHKDYFNNLALLLGCKDKKGDCVGSPPVNGRNQENHKITDKCFWAVAVGYCGRYVGNLLHGGVCTVDGLVPVGLPLSLYNGGVMVTFLPLSVAPLGRTTTE